MNAKSSLSALIILAGATQAAAYNAPLTASELTVARGTMNVALQLDLASLNVKSNQQAIVTPFIITAKGDSIALDPVAVYGRKQMIHSQRLRQTLPAATVKASDAAGMAYTQTLPYSAALNGARVAVKVQTFGCADCLKSTRWVDGGDWHMPELNPADAVVYQVPQATAIKETAISGKAYVEFPVNKTTLLTDFRTNATELAKITATIDSVKSDPDITVTSISIKGYASPEGSYANNTRLAKGRTEALKTWVMNLYSFPAGFITTDFEPEDWQGLREAVVADTSLPDREGLLGIINNSSLDPDTRDLTLRTQYPEAYSRLLNEIYPALRHSDYSVNYTIRSFSSPAEILEVMKSNPAKLSADEFFVAAQSLDPESEMFKKVILTAAETHPANEAANLNAASVALKAGNLDDAERYLSRAGFSAEAVYSRGLLALERKDYGTAEMMLNQAAKQGFEPAAALLPKVIELKQINQ